MDIERAGKVRKEMEWLGGDSDGMGGGGKARG